MAKKKPQYPKRNRNILIGSLITLGAIGLIITGFFINHQLDEKAKSYIATIKGEQVSTAEFRLALTEQQLSVESSYGSSAGMWTQDTGMGYTLEDMAKNEALNNLIVRKVSALKAAEMGLDTLTEEQQTEADSIAENFSYTYGDGIVDYIGLTADEMRQSFMESSYVTNVHTAVTEEYVLDQEALDLAFETYFTGAEDDLTTYEFSHILTDSREAIDAAMAEYAEGAEFIDLMAKYSRDYVDPEAVPETPPEEGDPEEEPADEPESEPEEEPVDEPEGEPEEEPADQPEGELEEEPVNEPEEEPVNEPEGEPEEEPADEPEGEPEDGSTGVFVNDQEVPEDAITIDDDLGVVLDMSFMEVNPNVLTVTGGEMPADVGAAMFATEQDAVTDVIELYADDLVTVENYLVIKIVKKELPDKEAEKVTYTDETFIPEAKNAYYNEAVNAWT
ncbi:MAG: SurA N-terminal domain-containing protein [Clostridiales bacterium]|jgi:parvulin-like peptidyl-prolyl isomerase|nr:SurA N-terminal domain-containing protein [Clostridiales bacterium]